MPIKTTEDSAIYQERIDEPTPNGGVYSIAYYQNAKGDRARKEDSERVEIIEYGKADEQVFRTYMEREPRT